MSATEAMGLMHRRGHRTLDWLGIWFANDSGIEETEDLWADVLDHQAKDWIKPGLFYLYVAYSGDRLNLLVNTTTGAAHTAEMAVALSELAVFRYDEVWVVSDAGAWSAKAGRS